MKSTRDVKPGETVEMIRDHEFLMVWNPGRNQRSANVKLLKGQRFVVTNTNGDRGVWVKTFYGNTFVTAGKVQVVR